MDRMSPLDASFLHVEGDVNHMHIGSVGIFEGPPPSHGELAAMVESKLPLVPRYRQRVRFVPLDLGRPVWVDDAHFNIDYHLRRTALPAPGGSRELRNLVGRLMSQQLDRSKPLWEMWAVENLEEGRWAIVSKVHHCMVDGVASSDLLSVVLDDAPEVLTPVPDDHTPRHEPSNLRLALDAVVEGIVRPYEQVRRLRAVTRGPRHLSDMARGLWQARSVLRGPGPSSLTGEIGPHRRWAWARATLDDVRTVRKLLGGTVNDVVLTVITRGFRDLLLSRGEDVTGRVVRTLVPVSVRSAEERGTYNNRVSALAADLPVGIADPEERLRTIRTQMDGLKQSKQAVAGDVLSTLSGFAPPLLLALGARVAARAARRFSPSTFQTVTTNVPGPQHPLYACGRRMVEVFPYVPVADPVRVGVAIFSYDGGLGFGVTGDWETASDIDILCIGIESAMAELVETARRTKSYA